ncbi:MAG: alpha/beta hydrolase [Sphingomonas bacterium]|nr:alpha/beta hydrolase [Sphingomonas bacterium]
MISAATFETVRLRGDGLDLAADVFGPVDGTPVLFFHGGGQSRRSWRGSARAIGRAGYRAMTFDLRGHGESDWAPDGDYLLDAYARDVEALVDGLAGPVVLVGASRGGQAALVAAARRPGRIGLAMLADSAPRLRDEGVENIRGFFRLSSLGFESVEAAADALVEHLHQPRVTPASGLARALRTADDGRLYWHWDPKTVSPEFLNPPSEGIALETAAATMRDPLVLVRGEFSSIVTPESVAHFRMLAPQLEVIEAKGAGHMFTADRNDVFAEQLLAQLARHAPLP